MVNGCVGLGGDVAEGVVDDVVGDVAVRVEEVADGAEVVGEGVEDFAAGLLVGQDLVDGGAPEVAVGDRIGFVDFEDDLVAVVFVMGGCRRAAGRRRRRRLAC